MPDCLRLKQELKMSDNNAKPSLPPPPPRRQPAANAATMEDNIAIRKTKSVKFKFENVRKVEVICEFDKNLPVENSMKKTLQSDEHGRQPAVQNKKEDILTPPTAVQSLNLKSRNQNPQKIQIKEASLDWPHPELTEQ